MQPEAAEPTWSMATEALRRRERFYRLARWGLVIASIGIVWTVVRWPDARRVPIDCTVIDHRSAEPGKRGHDGEVGVRVLGEESWFIVVSRTAPNDEISQAFSEWPIGSTKTCWKLPYASSSERVTASNASWFPSLGVVASGVILFLGSLFVARRPNGPQARATRTGNPYRDTGEREAPPQPLTIVMRSSARKARTIASAALAFWALLFGAFFLLGATAKTSAGSIVEPGSAMRLGLLLFAIIGLGIPGGFFFWPSTYVLLVRKKLYFDAREGVLGFSQGVPYLVVARWIDLPHDLRVEGDVFVGTGIEAPLPVLSSIGAAERCEVSLWLEAFRAWGPD